MNPPLCFAIFLHLTIFFTIYKHENAHQKWKYFINNTPWIEDYVSIILMCKCCCTKLLSLCATFHIAKKAMNEWMHEWMNEWMNAGMNVWFPDWLQHCREWHWTSWLPAPLLGADFFACEWVNRDVSLSLPRCLANQAATKLHKYPNTAKNSSITMTVVMSSTWKFAERASADRRCKITL